jgi:PncC family amidohydrolase
MDELKIEEKILKEMVEQQASLSIAESCTGGFLSAKLTSVPGASAYFLGGMVVYSNEMKMQWLGVPSSTLFEKGAVSSEVAEAMVRGILEKSGSLYALSVTGIAGPSGGSLEKPVGTVWYSIGKKNGPVASWKMHLQGSRQKNIETAAEIVLERLYTYLKK